MASYGILGFLGGVGEAGKDLADKAVDNNYKVAAEERQEHNEQARIKMAQAFEQKTYERGRADDLTDAGVQRDAQLADQTTQRSYQVEDATTASLDADRRAREASASAAAQGALKFERDKEIQTMKLAGRDGNYSEIATGTNPASGQVEQYRVNNRTNEQEWLGAVPSNPLADAKLIKAQADADKSLADVKKLDQDEKQAISVTRRGIEIADAILAPENEGAFDSSVGIIDANTPTFRQSTKDMENRISAFQSILTKENLGIMSGVLSETDMAIIIKISNGEINLSNSSPVVRRAIQSARDSLVSNLEGRGYSLKADEPQQRRSTDQQSDTPKPGMQYKGMSDEDFMNSKPGGR